MSAPISLKGCRMVMVMRGRLGRSGYMHVDRVLEHPRLTRLRWRATSRDPTVTTWRVDECPAATLDEALQRLAEPPRPYAPPERPRPAPLQPELPL